MTRVELGSAIGLALATVREHKMRSFLTVLGVIIGTGTIIGVGSIIAGLDGAVTGIMRSFGTNTAIVFNTFNDFVSCRYSTSFFYCFYFILSCIFFSSSCDWC